MSAGPRMKSLFTPEQFRMPRFQIYNWGTFSDIHEVPISEQSFLFVGRSGSGKSMLLDAFSALLVRHAGWISTRRPGRPKGPAGIETW